MLLIITRYSMLNYGTKVLGKITNSIKSYKHRSKYMVQKWEYLYLKVLN